LPAGTDGLSHGYMLSGGQFTFFNDPLAVNGTRTFGINASGQIVGIYFDANFTFRGFLLNQGQYTPIDEPLAGIGAFLGTIPFSINASGQIVGQYIDSAGINHGFLLSGGVYTTIDDPLGVGSQGGTQPSQINDQGQIVGGYFDASGLSHGYIQIGSQYTTVDDPAGNPPGQGSFVNGINDPGQLVGGYYDATGLEHGFLATPPRRRSVSGLVGMSRRSANRAPASPPRAKPTARCASASRSVERARTSRKPGNLSQKTTRGQAGLTHRKRRTSRRSATGRSRHGRSATVRR
jgi:uncharacterized membrane protein